jgi:hypothetical protein
MMGGELDGRSPDPKVGLPFIIYGAKTLTKAIRNPFVRHIAIQCRQPHETWGV